MTTISSGGPAEPHRHRRIAESFGVDAAGYDRARPGYPPAMVTAFGDASPGPEALDVGCGTGIASRQFQAEGWRVLGVEPDPRMAEFARSTGLTVEVSTFEDWDPRARDFDAVVAATAWHWVDPRAGAVKAAGVLRPGGLLGLAWNVGVQPPEVEAALATALERVMPGSPLTAKRRQPGVAEFVEVMDGWADRIRDTGAFAEPRRSRFDWRQTYTRDQMLALLPTQGLLTRLPSQSLAEVLDEVGKAVDAIGGECTTEYATVTVTANRRG